VNEAAYVEMPLIEWLSGSIDAGGLGWEYRDEQDMASFGRALEDPLVEGLLVAAIRKINTEVGTDDEARLAVDTLRAALSTPDPLAANRLTLELLRDGVRVVLRPGDQQATTVRLIEFDPDKQDLNDFTVTNQYRVQGLRQVRDDMVLLVNGIPLVIGEFKSFVTSGKDWREGVQQIHRYQRQAPLMLASNVFCVAADEEEFRYGTILFHDASKEQVEQHLDSWGGWLSRYPEHPGWWNDPAADAQEDPLEVPVRGLLRLEPCHVLDFLQHFVVFETKHGRTTKKVARYQQFEAVNQLVDRTVGLVGKPATAQDRTGLVWHTQGSGKSLTMVYAGYKLRRHPALGNPTVLIVVDRRDLKTQLADDFEAADYPSVDKALGIQDLKHRLSTDWRGTLVTTIQSFQQMGDLPPVQRDNVISLVDEAHRSQKGSSKESYAMTMRVKLEQGFRFGFTGTPIDRTLQNTHRDFGPYSDGVQERYLSHYGIKRAIRDGATLEVHYIRDRVPFRVDEDPISGGFEEMCEDMELEDEEAKDLVQRQKSNWKELARHPERAAIVADKVLKHFLEFPDPSGFKAQLVVVDRKACAIYKRLLDERLAARGLPPEWCDVVISSAQNSEPEIAQYEYPKAKQDDLIEHFKLTPGEWETRNRDQFGEDRHLWRPPLKILIVCDRLLTGFDAPVEQVMYLDKPLRDHNLLQAVARTNRPLPQMGKRTGAVVDYFGVFKDLNKALNFDVSVREEALIDWDSLRQSLPAELERCAKPFEGVGRQATRANYLAALRRLSDPDAAKAFEQDFRSLERLWEALAPDTSLYDHRHDYSWLCSVFVAYRRRKSGPTDTYGELAAKTRRLIEQHTEFFETAEELPVFRIDGDYVEEAGKLPTAADRAAALEAMLTRELEEDDATFTYRRLGERLRRLKQRRDAADAATEERLKELEQLAADAADAKRTEEELGLKDPGPAALFAVLREHSPADDDQYVAECARAMVDYLRRSELLTPGWSATRGGPMRVEQSLLVESWNERYARLGFDVDDAHPPFLTPATEALAESEG
jgi:type I restriction enzyme, R subunit